jgi:hypothetical protein
MWDRWRRWFQWVGAASFAIFGVLALLPDWAVAQFPWGVGPVMAMTMGAWGIGTAAMAALAASQTSQDRILGLNVYLWLFGILELLVVVAFADRLQVGHVLTWPYLLGLAALAASAVAGVIGWANERPDLRGPAGTVTWWMRAIAIGLGGFTALLAIGTLMAGPDGRTAQGGVVPEPLSLFSIRAFSAFLAAISAATFAMLLPRNPRPAWELDRGGFILSTAILVVALLHVGAFDFGSQPGGLVYVGAYGVASILFAIIWVMPWVRPELFAADPPSRAGLARLDTA